MVQPGLGGSGMVPDPPGDPGVNGRKRTFETVIGATSLLDHCEHAAVMAGTDGDLQWQFFDIRPEMLGLSADRDLD